MWNPVRALAPLLATLLVTSCAAPPPPPTPAPVPTPAPAPPPAPRAAAPAVAPTAALSPSLPAMVATLGAVGSVNQDLDPEDQGLVQVMASSAFAGAFQDLASTWLVSNSRASRLELSFGA